MSKLPAPEILAERLASHWEMALAWNEAGDIDKARTELFKMRDVLNQLRQSL